MFLGALLDLGLSRKELDAELAGLGVDYKLKVSKVVRGAIAAKYRNTGQTCICANRFYAQRGIAEEFTSKLAAAASALTVGPGSETSSDIGPLINAAAHSKVSVLVASAVSAGADVRTGGAPSDRGGLFYEPTVLGEVTADMEIASSEIFGPVSSVITFDTEAEAVASANDCHLAAVFRQMQRFLQRGVAADDDNNFLVLEQPGVAERALRNAAPHEFGLARYAELFQPCARGDDNAGRAVGAGCGCRDLVVAFNR